MSLPGPQPQDMGLQGCGNRAHGQDLRGAAVAAGSHRVAQAGSVPFSTRKGRVSHVGHMQAASVSETGAEARRLAAESASESSAPRTAARTRS